MAFRCCVIKSRVPGNENSKGIYLLSYVEFRHKRGMNQHRELENQYLTLETFLWAVKTGYSSRIWAFFHMVPTHNIKITAT